MKKAKLVERKYEIVAPENMPDGSLTIHKWALTGTVAEARWHVAQIASQVKAHVRLYCTTDNVFVGESSDERFMALPQTEGGELTAVSPRIVSASSMAYVMQRLTTAKD